jgi:GT2 family glycosyltransferase
MTISRSIGERVTILVSPRQRWSLAVRSLEAVIDRMPPGCQVIYVNGGAPDEIAARLEDMVRGIGGVWVSKDCVLCGNEARNLGMPYADREFVVFVDNDVIPAPGWIEALVECADGTGASVVGPLIFHGTDESSQEIHIAGGEVVIADRVMTVNERHFAGDRLADVDDRLERSPSSQLEFHCLLLTRAFAESMVPFDEDLRTLGDHEDVVLSAERQGLGVWFEPSSKVAYVTKLRLDDSEIGFWQLRWSEDWNGRSLRRFCEKWDIEPGAGWPPIARRWAASERTRWYHGRGPVLRRVGQMARLANRSRVSSWIVRHLEERIMSRAAKPEIRRREQVLGHA